nr:MAG TPA: hypothetical protein [Caudoviricetes sp.]
MQLLQKCNSLSYMAETLNVNLLSLPLQRF